MNPPPSSQEPSVRDAAQAIVKYSYEHPRNTESDVLDAFYNQEHLIDDLKRALEREATSQPVRDLKQSPRPASQAAEAEAINRDLFEACRATRNLLRPCLEEPHRTVFWKCVDAMNQAMQLAAAPPSSESAPSHKGEAK